MKYQIDEGSSFFKDNWNITQYYIIQGYKHSLNWQLKKNKYSKWETIPQTNGKENVNTESVHDREPAKKGHCVYIKCTLQAIRELTDHFKAVHVCLCISLPVCVCFFNMCASRMGPICRFVFKRPESFLKSCEEQFFYCFNSMVTSS